MADKNPRDRKFETLFDGDEIEGKFYPLGAGVTGIDAPTAEYLIRAGRIAEVDDERFGELKAPGRPDSQTGETAGDEGEADAETDEERAEREAREAEAAADAERLEAAHTDLNEGRIPDDLIDADKPADATDRLISEAKLRELAKAANATVKSSSTKSEIATAIMAARAKAEADAGSTS